MVAPSYSDARRSMAQKIGLGRKSGVRKATTAVSPAATAAAPASAKGVRQPKMVGRNADQDEIVPRAKDEGGRYSGNITTEDLALS